MATRITVGESNITIFYRFDFPGGFTFKVAATPLDTRTARQVLGNVTEDYSLIVPLFPQGLPWPFLMGMAQNPDYVRINTGLEGQPLAFLVALLPELTTLPPADVLADVADAWFISLSV